MDWPNRLFGMSRNCLSEKGEITTKDVKIESLVKDWLESFYWEASSFESILKQAGISLPVVLSDLDTAKESFTCTTSEGKKYILRIYYGKYGNFPEIYVSEGNELRKYELRFNFHNSTNLVIYLLSRSVTKGNRTITGNYMYKLMWDVNLGDKHSLKVLINVPKSYIIDTNKCKEAEEYLLSLSTGTTIDTLEVYNNLIGILSISKEVVEECENICITHSVWIDNKSEVIGEIKVECGYILEYKISHQGNSYHVFSNGNWVYSNQEGVKVSSINDNTTVSITGNIDRIASVNPISLLLTVEEEIGQFWEMLW